MAEASAAATPRKHGIAVPHVLVLLIALIVIVCGLTYVLPAGEYAIDPVTHLVVPNSFHYVENTPVNLWQALIMVTKGIASQGVIFALLFIMGGMISVVIESGAINSVINYSVWKLEDKSIRVLVPCIVVLMSVIGGLAGQDSLVAFVAVGMVLTRKLHLDKLAALGMFYLPYITGQAAGPTIAIILMAQETAGLPPVSGLGARLLVWLVLTLLCVAYTTRYCLKISRDPSKSIIGYMEKPDPKDAAAMNAKPEMGAKDLITIAAMFVPFCVYAYGAASKGWGFPQLLAFALLAVFVIGIVQRMNVNKLASVFVKGAAAMGGICLMIGFAKVIGMVMVDGKILHTFAYGAVQVIGGLHNSLVATGIFIFTTLFNLLIPSGPAKVPMLIPLFIPVADVLGVSRQVLCLAFQLGDGLSNCITPVSAVLAAAMSLSGCNIGQWLKFVLPFVLTTFLVAIAALTILQSIGWA
ncbi:MAG: AbgT family transporter [Sutterellaceae bacterium]|nr:AbgT family transporter [Sutterellaceae bacterium]MDY2868347.1 AbgT family transporter [Mesosutterella sp.]